MKKLLSFFIILFSGCNLALATQCAIPTTYTTTGQVTAVNLNNNFSACQSTVNGLLDNTNANTASGYRFYQVVSSLPAAGNQGAAYFLTTDNSMNLDNGSSFNKFISPSGSAAQGEVLFYGASGLTYTGVGSSGQPLISQGASANATFGNISAAGAVSGASFTSLSSVPSGAGLMPQANIGGLLGTWISKSTGTAYQASTDGKVQWTGQCASGGYIEIYTDGNSSPSTQRGAFQGSPAGGILGEATSLVRKNDYYEIYYNANGGSCTNTNINFISIGS